MTTPGTRADAQGTGALGAPPPSRGDTPAHRDRYAIACRASAVVLARGGHQLEAQRLHELAAGATPTSSRHHAPSEGRP